MRVHCSPYTQVSVWSRAMWAELKVEAVDAWELDSVC